MTVRVMKGFDLKEALTRLGMNQNELADRLGIHRNTVATWNATGEVPKYAVAYVELLEQARSFKSRALLLHESLDV